MPSPAPLEPTARSRPGSLRNPRRRTARALACRDRSMGRSPPPPPVTCIELSSLPPGIVTPNGSLLGPDENGATVSACGKGDDRINASSSAFCCACLGYFRHTVASSHRLRDGFDLGPQTAKRPSLLRGAPRLEIEIPAHAAAPLHMHSRSLFSARSPGTALKAGTPWARPPRYCPPTPPARRGSAYCGPPWADGRPVSRSTRF